ncbi:MULTISPECIES: ATP-binding cassette domain-containing protein [Actinoplanes]|uniref:ABC transporter ATP-binding protein n=1 Tax=Actinoplanes TaxID=1865 RepID=UPI0005F2FB30|nr:MULTISPECIES: ATP-binding cassette domain-containing protein [Actinoplanes]GLY08397.1 ABC transporter ATP-binding protein [Actinoplanes sp. NBRC 101535]
MIRVENLTKTYGRIDAVRDVTFSAAPGRITGLLGLNGSGKTTTLRMLLGLTRPTSGSALLNGVPYRDLVHPVRQVGAVLEQGLSNPGQTGYQHLVTHALLCGASRRRAAQLIEEVGLADAAGRRTGDYSLGMRQRLAVATALLGDPGILVLDEPANGLDPSGMAWLRDLLWRRAAAGGTVLISSHLLAELQQLVVDVVIIALGEVRLAAPLAELSGAGRLRIRGGDPRRLWHAFERHGARVTTDGTALLVEGLSPEDAGGIALHAQVPVFELTIERPRLEEIFLQVAGAR